MVIIGLTGSIGMGKSTTADLFRNAGVPVHDSDACVHALYASSAVPFIASRFPGAIHNNIVDRNSLSKIVLNDPTAMKDLEKIVHPLVAKDRDMFLERCRLEGHRIAVLDVPLLFEIGAANLADIIVVVTASETVQKSRVLARSGMTKERFEQILARQIPDAEKRRQAHFVIKTDTGIDAARYQVIALLKSLTGVT